VPSRLMRPTPWLGHPEMIGKFHLAHVGFARFHAGYLKLGAVTVEARFRLGSALAGFRTILPFSKTGDPLIESMSCW